MMIANTGNEQHETRRRAKDRREAIKSTQSECEDEVQVRDGP